MNTQVEQLRLCGRALSGLLNFCNTLIQSYRVQILILGAKIGAEAGEPMIGKEHGRFGTWIAPKCLRCRCHGRSCKPVGHGSLGRFATDMHLAKVRRFQQAYLGWHLAMSQSVRAVECKCHCEVLCNNPFQVASKLIDLV